MRIVLLFIAIVVMSCSGSKKTAKKTVGVNFVESKTLSSVLDKARDEGKLVFVDVYADWCIPCKLMDEELFSDPVFAKRLAKDFVSYKVDGEKGNGPDLTVMFQVYAYPTLLFLDANGRVLVRNDGSAFHRKMYELMDAAIVLGGK